MDGLLARISVDPNVCCGVPCIRDTQIPISVILELLAGGMDTEQVMAEYPQLVSDDILAAVVYDAETPEK